MNFNSAVFGWVLVQHFPLLCMEAIVSWMQGGREPEGNQPAGGFAADLEPEGFSNLYWCNTFLLPRAVGNIEGSWKGFTLPVVTAELGRVTSI